MKYMVFIVLLCYPVFMKIINTITHIPVGDRNLFRSYSYLFQLQTLLTSYGHDIKQTPYAVQGFERGDGCVYSLQLTVSGRGLLQYHGESYTINPGEIMLVKAPGDYIYYVGKDENWEFLYLTIAGDEALRIWDKIAAETGPVCRLPEHLLSGMQEIIQKADRLGPKGILTLSGLCYQFSMKFLEWVLLKPILKDEPYFIQLIEDYIVKNYHTAFDTQDICTHIGLSRFHLAREFKKHRGISITDCITRTRIDKSISLLADPLKTLDQIAAEVGYSNANYYCRVFKEYTGKSPGKFRKAFWQ